MEVRRVLFRSDRGFTVLGIVHRLAGDHFYFQVGAGQRELSAPHLHQQVGQHRQGLSPLDHVDHLREWFQEDFALQAEAHADPLNVECLPSFEWMDKSRTVVEMVRPEEHTSELQSLMRISYAVLCLKKKNKK